MLNITPNLQAPSQSLFQRNSTGFNFDNRERDNQLAEREGFIPKPPTTTGSTVVGIKYRDGVILATDRQGTADGRITTNCMKKIYRLQENIYAGGSGVCGDLHQVARLTRAEMDLHQLQMGCKVPVVCANHFVKHMLYRYQGNIKITMLIGGVDNGGPSLYSTWFEGSTTKIPFAAQGSGNCAALPVLEKGWNASLDEKSAESLAIDAVRSGIRNDLYSGSPIHICIIRTDYSVSLYDKIFAGIPVPRPPVLRVKPQPPKVLFAADHTLEPIANSMHSLPPESDQVVPKGTRTALALARLKSKKIKETTEIDG
ncbi:GL21838 [Drosophila persimilis]|uniref:Proteasome subunit beta n=1 Tax=Drosophila persimilis TaxID=7234 RepID=B4GED6_DROPE|nr:proteasome subunit beta type-7 [Drosophila persimilis]EDW33971.1 GL21838 [Drosophila persimilis]